MVKCRANTHHQRREQNLFFEGWWKTEIIRRYVLPNGVSIFLLESLDGDAIFHCVPIKLICNSVNKSIFGLSLFSNPLCTSTPALDPDQSLYQEGFWSTVFLSSCFENLQALEIFTLKLFFCQRSCLTTSAIYLVRWEVGTMFMNTKID